METLIEHGLLALGIGAAAAVVLGFVGGHALSTLFESDETSTQVACVVVLLLVVACTGGLLKAKAAGCPDPPAYGQIDLRDTVCHWSKPQSKVPTFPTVPSGGFTLPGT
ncbi:hypothetical protein GCM10027446_11600 [Angustibacter peucedani]